MVMDNEILKQKYAIRTFEFKKMKHFKSYLSAFCVICITLACNGNKENKSLNSTENSTPFSIVWKDILQGDFAFAKDWSYPEGIYKNQFGQLSCDGLCPPETDRMKDEDGKIYKDSLTAFYQLVDTTHIYQTLQSESEFPEFLESPEITVKRRDQNTVIATTAQNSATHTVLTIKIIKDKYFSSTVELNSIKANENSTYSLLYGDLEIDQQEWKKGLMKAKFNFLFKDPKNPKTPIKWNGKIFAKVEL